MGIVTQHATSRLCRWMVDRAFALPFGSRTLGIARARLAWWMVDKALRWFGTLALLLVGCAGAPFESQSDAGSAVAGAQSRGGSVTVGGAPSLAGVAAVAGGNDDGGAVGSAGDGAELGGGAGASSSAGAPSAQPCSRVGWQLSAFASREDEPPALAIDGDDATRWASGTEREAGQWLELELAAASTLEALELANVDAAADLPDSLIVSVDGVRVSTRWRREPRGIVGTLEEPSRGRVVRLELDAPAFGWWTVGELTGRCAP